ncbi:HAMP domain-containing protein, partial [bacterium]
IVIVARLLEDEVPARRLRVVEATSTEHFKLSWSQTPVENGPASPLLRQMQRQIVRWEPSLRGREINLRLVPLDDGTEVVGSLRLSDGTWLVFTARDLVSSSPLEWRQALVASVPMLLIVLVAVFALRTILLPLSLLSNAVAKAGHETPTLLQEKGIPELRRLTRAFNEMHARIFGMIKARTEALAAVGHDLRTPLARLRFRVDEVPDDSMRADMTQDLDEMELMLDSLLTYFRGDDHAENRRLVDLAVMITSVVDDLQDRGFEASYVGPVHCDAWLRPVEFKRALSNLANNACQYGDRCVISLEEGRKGIRIRVLDDGPGIPEEHLAAVLEPFMRLDPARQRNTSGVGLGIPITVRVVNSAGGTLTLSNRPEGGLCAEIQLPKASGAVDARSEPRRLKSEA